MTKHEATDSKINDLMPMPTDTPSGPLPVVAPPLTPPATIPGRVLDLLQPIADDKRDIAALVSERDALTRTLTELHTQATEAIARRDAVTLKIDEKNADLNVVNTIAESAFRALGITERPPLPEPTPVHNAAVTMTVIDPRDAFEPPPESPTSALDDLYVKAGGKV